MAYRFSEGHKSQQEVLKGDAHTHTLSLSLHWRSLLAKLDMQILKHGAKSRLDASHSRGKQHFHGSPAKQV